MNEKQQQLTFDKGITNVPSDALCSDNALEESLGMVYDDGEHRVIQKPVEFMTLSDGFRKLVYVHDSRYIELLRTGTGTYSYSLVWRSKDGNTTGTVYSSVPNDDVSLTSIGKTVIISTTGGLRYAVWNGTTYNEFSSIPTPEVNIRLVQVNLANVSNTSDGNLPVKDARALIVSKLHEDIVAYNNNLPYTPSDKEDDFDNLMRGLYAEAKKNAAKNKRFTEPFFVRYALELYDGSYIHISQPILIFPSVRNNFCTMFNGTRAYLSINHAQLEFVSKTNYEKLSDIVRNVVIFASKGVNLISAGTKCKIDRSIEIRPDGIDELIGYRYNEYGNPWGIPLREVRDIENDIKSTSIFYKLAEIGISEINDYTELGQYMDEFVVENLTTQEQLKQDDYFSHCQLTATLACSYNSRLHLSGLSRGFFDGFTYFSPYDNSAEATYTALVRIKTDSGERYAKKEYSTKQKQGLWFYYPDSRASWVTIYKGDTVILSSKLTEHPGLHGAYYFNGLPVGGYTEGDGTPAGNPIAKNTPHSSVPEPLYNQLAVSEVNNPFAFYDDGYISVGTKAIVGMSPITKALSEGQFGQFPLIVFSEDGIWSLLVASTGYYTSAHPMSREVALPENPCITQTDGAIFFASKKGLMVVDGSQVKCVSEQLSGKTNVFTIGVPPNIEVLVSDLGHFCDFLKTAFIAYDYRDSLLWLFDGTHTICYVYAIKSGTFSKYDFGTNNAIENVVNNYPDYLLQSGTAIYSLTERDNINSTAEQANSYNANILTRPMKLENALALKSLMQVRHIKDFTNYIVEQTVEDPETHEESTVNVATSGTLALRIFASNNLNNWAELHSLRGTPWKYYRFLYNFAGLKATDRYAGTMLISQERRTNKMR